MFCAFVFHVKRTLNDHESCEVNILKEVTTMQALVSDFYDEIHIDLFGVEMLHEFIGSFCCATSCQEVIMD